MASKIAVMCSAPPSWKDLTDISTKTHIAWCTAHGYDYWFDCSSVSDRIRTPYFGGKVGDSVSTKGFVKLDLLTHFMDRGYEWVVWLDADLLITNPERSLEQLFTSGVIPYRCENPSLPSGHDIILPYDYNGHNATVIVARNTKLAYDFLWASNNAGRTMYLAHDWAEMEAMRYFAQTPPYHRIIKYLSIKRMCPLFPGLYAAMVPDRVSHGYEWERGDWSVHLAAMSVPVRVQHARHVMEMIAT